MRVMDRNSNEQKQKLDRLRSQQKKPPNIYSSHETLSQHDWEELIGVHKDTCKRVNGKIKRR